MMSMLLLVLIEKSPLSNIVLALLCSNGTVSLNHLRLIIRVLAKGEGLNKKTFFDQSHLLQLKNVENF